MILEEAENPASSETPYMKSPRVVRVRAGSSEKLTAQRLRTTRILIDGGAAHGS